MSKRSLYSLMAVIFIVGVGLGVLGYWFLADKLPQNRAIAEAKKQQEELNRMVRFGLITAVKPDEITIKVERSGDSAVQAGKEYTIKVDAGTAIQEGMSLINRPGQGSAPDMTKLIKAGMKVDVLEKNGRAVALHWENSESGIAYSDSITN